MHKELSEFMKNKGYFLTSVDLFSGPGGLATGFKWAGIYPLLAVEISETTSMTYCWNHDSDLFELDQYLKDKHYKDPFLIKTVKPVLIKGDIRKVDSGLIRELLKKRYGLETVDIVSGGAPCESFSLAGKRKNSDPRDTLFLNIIRIAKSLNSKAILFENVKGILSKKMESGDKKAIQLICQSFESKEKPPFYQLASKEEDVIILNASNYGVPQNRERVFLVGLRENLNTEFEYPAPEYGPGTDKPFLTSGEAILDLPEVNSRETATYYRMPEKFISENQKFFLNIMRGNYYSKDFNNQIPSYLSSEKNNLGGKLTSHKGPGHRKLKLELLKNIKVGESMKTAYERITREGKLDELRHLFPKTIYGSRNRRLRADLPAFTVTSHCLDEMLHPSLNRAITPREAARLQSFPDWYEFKGPYVAFHSSPEQDRYEQIGDAIPPLLAYALGKQLRKALC